MAKIQTAVFNDFVKNAKVEWRKGYERVPLKAKALYDVRMSDKLTSEHSSLDGFTFARRKVESDDYFQENPTQNYSKTMTKYRVGLMATITWEMRKYDRQYLSSLLEIVNAKFLKFRENLKETILSETQKWGRATTIIGIPKQVML